MTPDYEYTLWIESRFKELKSLRNSLIDEFRTRGKNLQFAAYDLSKRGGVTNSDKYPYCVWIDFPALAARITFYEDARIDADDGNFHPGRFGYAMFFKNLKDTGGSCPSSNTPLKEADQILYNLDNRHLTNLRIEKSNFPAIISEFEAFLEINPETPSTTPTPPYPQSHNSDQSTP